MGDVYDKIQAGYNMEKDMKQTNVGIHTSVTGVPEPPVPVSAIKQTRARPNAVASSKAMQPAKEPGTQATDANVGEDWWARAGLPTSKSVNGRTHQVTHEATRGGVWCRHQDSPEGQPRDCNGTRCPSCNKVLGRAILEQLKQAPEPAPK